jgi:hypothetical protein
MRLHRSEDVTRNVRRETTGKGDGSMRPLSSGSRKVLQDLRKRPDAGVAPKRLSVYDLYRIAKEVSLKNGWITTNLIENLDRRVRRVYPVFQASGLPRHELKPDKVKKIQGFQ